jgi:hypothetical protein
MSVCIVSSTPLANARGGVAHGKLPALQDGVNQKELVYPFSNGSFWLHVHPSIDLAREHGPSHSPLLHLFRVHMPPLIPLRVRQMAGTNLSGGDQGP